MCWLQAVDARRQWHLRHRRRIVGTGYNRVFVDGVMQHRSPPSQPRHRRSAPPGHGRRNRFSTHHYERLRREASGATARQLHRRRRAGVGVADGRRRQQRRQHPHRRCRHGVHVGGPTSRTRRPTPAAGSSTASSTSSSTPTAGRFFSTNPARRTPCTLRIAGAANPRRVIEMAWRNWCVDVNNLNYITVRGLKLRAGHRADQRRSNVLENFARRVSSQPLPDMFRRGSRPTGRPEGSGVLVSEADSSAQLHDRQSTTDSASSPADATSSRGHIYPIPETARHLRRRAGPQWRSAPRHLQYGPRHRARHPAPRRARFNSHVPTTSTAPVCSGLGCGLHLGR